MKKRLLGIIIAVIIVVALIVVAVIIIQKNKGTGTKWGDIYLDVIKERSILDDSKIMFYESSLSDKPVMVIYNDTKRGEDTFETNFSMTIYKIENDKAEEITTHAYGDQHEIRFGYDTVKKNYNYFIYSSTEDSETYESIDSVALERIVSDEVEKEGLSGSERSNKEKEKLSEHDNYAYYYKVTNKKSTAYKDIDYVINTNYKINYIPYEKDENYLKKEFTKTVKSYQKNSEIGSNYKDLTEITNDKEETNKQEEPMEETLKAGDYSLNYGTYKSNVTEYMGEFGGEYTIKPDGTFSYTNTWKDYDGNISTNTASGTYEVRYANMKEIDEMPDDYKWVITFTAISYSGKGRFTDPTSPNDKYYNVDSYDITGNNKFQASQYENVWTLVN